MTELESLALLLADLNAQLREAQHALAERDKTIASLENATSRANTA